MKLVCVEDNTKWALLSSISWEAAGPLTYLPFVV
jgi:hypothetical protein